MVLLDQDENGRFRILFAGDRIVMQFDQYFPPCRSDGHRPLFFPAVEIGANGAAHPEILRAHQDDE